MKTLILLFSLYSTLALSQSFVRVATFDSGFGGFFTAKEIEKQTISLHRSHEAQFTITHYGDTANSPYGEKTPEQIADLSSKGITRAFDDGAELVFIACNTASTQFEAIKGVLNKSHPGRGERIVSIIESSVEELKKQIDDKLKNKPAVNVAILATPATIKAGSYIRALAKAYGLEAPENKITPVTQERWYKVKGKTTESVSAVATLNLGNEKVITITQIGPANWVEMIEHGAGPIEKEAAVVKDLSLLSSKTPWDIVGEFCTHFPAIDEIIKKESGELKLSTSETSYIKQGPLMAQIFREMMLKRLKPRTKKDTQNISMPTARIFISGKNILETSDLARTIFPSDPPPFIQQKPFSY